MTTKNIKKITLPAIRMKPTRLTNAMFTAELNVNISSVMNIYFTLNPL